MKRENVYDGISGIDPAYIEEAEKHVFSSAKKQAVLMWLAAAAVFLVLGGVGVYAAGGGFTIRKLSVNGYEVAASISRIPLQKFTGKVKEASAIIREQHRNYKPFDNQSPDAFYKTMDSIEEAAAYVGYGKLQVPAFPYEQADITVEAQGDSKGRIREIRIQRDCITEDISVQNWTTMFTTNYDKDVFEIEYPDDIASEMTEFVTGAGLQCLVFESEAEAADRHGLSAYITTGDVVYMCHTAFYTAGRAEAEKIIHDWAESLK